MEDVNYQLKKRNTDVTLPEPLGFGQHFTDHVFEMDYTPDKGWHNKKIKPLENFNMHPATMFLHYGQGIFEGLKAHYTKDEDIILFRPEKHIRRINNSAKRMCMPTVDEEELLNILQNLVSVDKQWVPKNQQESLYIRPFMFASDPFLGVRPSHNYKFQIMLSPVGAYYPEGFKPVKILAQDDFVRAIRKGLGECKTPANYAASLYAQEEAKKEGFTQVLWLDGVEFKYIEEVGTMNIFIRFKDEVVTPALTGGILPGVTRDSVLSLLEDWGVKAVERKVSIDELIEEYDKGNVLEIFGTGTAAVISAVGEMKYKGKDMIINNGEVGELSQKLYDEITAIQHAEAEDKHNWIVKVGEWVAV